MKVAFADSFYKSIKRLARRQRWWYKIYDFFRYNLPYFIRNIWYFRKELWQHRPWDYQYSLMMFRRSLESLGHTIEVYGNEVEESRLKKVAKIKRAVELLNRVREDYYIEDAEKELGELVRYDWEFEPVPGNENFQQLVDKESPEEKDHNRRVYKRAEEIEEQEWEELWSIIKGQDHKEYVEIYNKLTDEEKRERDAWYDWYDGSGAKHWWD